MLVCLNIWETEQGRSIGLGHRYAAAPGGPWKRQVVPVRSVRKPHCPISTARAFSCCTTCGQTCTDLRDRQRQHRHIAGMRKQKLDAVQAIAQMESARAGYCTCQAGVEASNRSLLRA